MNFVRFIFAFVMLLQFVGGQANALDATQTISFKNAVNDLNKIKPLQNPRHAIAEDILSRNMIDTRNKVVGEVNDVLFDAQGQVASLLVSFDRLRLGQAVFLNYSTIDIQNVSNGYKMGFAGDQVEEIYPELLSDIETAAGDASLISLLSVLDRPVVTDTGVQIGTLKDVLFDQSGHYIRSAYVQVNYNTIRDRGVAIPLNVLEFGHDGTVVTVTIDKDYADLIVQYVKDEK